MYVVVLQSANALLLNLRTFSNLAFYAKLLDCYATTELHIKCKAAGSGATRTKLLRAWLANEMSKFYVSKSWQAAANLLISFANYGAKQGFLLEAKQFVRRLTNFGAIASQMGLLR
uniref:Uncharacterized protein n=1 Tax=Tupiella akineta TaxID=160070 RepID=Q6UVW0_TUPAK|nr:hypothetical protein PsakpMp06 [Tupiella akineta]AAQ18715.1 hypothetical protein [Tupiella akineta]